MYLKSLGWYLLVLTVLFCRKIALGLAASILGHTGTLQRTFWISDPMHVFLAMEREQVLSRVRYEPKPQVLVQADQGLQSNSFLTETVSKIRNVNFQLWYPLSKLNECFISPNCWEDKVSGRKEVAQSDKRREAWDEWNDSLKTSFVPAKRNGVICCDFTATLKKTNQRWEGTRIEPCARKEAQNKKNGSHNNNAGARLVIMIGSLRCYYSDSP